MIHKHRRTVRCWFCGYLARRLPSCRGLSPRYWRPDGRVVVVGRKRRLQPYGVCGADLGHGERCREPMLLTRDARFVLRAVAQWERRGRNSASEFDR